MQFGKYQLVRKLATGGMAEVYLAKAAGPRGFEKTLVLKRILPHLAEDEAFVDMFLGEAKLAAQLDHPNVVQIFDFGEADGSYFLAMEFIDGPTLRRLIKRSVERGVPLPAGPCAKMVAAAAEGLAFAHDLSDEAGTALGLIHRDISPENVLVSRQGAVKVVDFGIAKVAGQSHRTQTGVVKGKVAYMPPEQLQAKSMDRRVDVYALGMVLYELLTGRRPFEATTEVSMMQAILFEPFVPAVERRADLPEALQRILERALAKDRDQRYPDCRAFQTDLERFVVSLGEPVGAYQISRLVAEVMEGSPTLPTPPPVAASKARETAALPVKVPESSPVLTTPMPRRGGAAAPAQGRAPPPKDVLADRDSMEAPAAGSGMFDAATDPATPSAGSLLPQVATSPRSNERKSLGSERASPLTVPEELPPVKPEALPSRRGMVVGAAVGLLAVSVGVTYFFLHNKAPAPTSVPVATKVEPPTKPLEPVAPLVTPEPRPEPKAPVPAVSEAVDAGSAGTVAVPGIEEARATPDAGIAPEPTVVPGRVPPAGTRLAKGKLSSDKPGAANTSTPRRSPAAPVQSRELAKGKLEFRVRPFGTVSLDGKPLGQTPFAAVEVTEGPHQVRVVNKDLDKDVTRTFEVKAGQDNVFKLNLLAE